MWKNYGGSIGGPLMIPKLYNGHNRTFFWIAGEAYRQNQTSSTKIAVPTAAERAGDFSQSRYTNGSLQTIYEPLSTSIGASGVYTRQPFPENVIPAGQMNGIGVKLASYFPLPNMPTSYYGQSNYSVTVPQYDRADQLDFKIDQEITRRWRGSVSYLHYGSHEPSYPYFQNIASPNQSLIDRHVDATQANTTVTATPTTVLSLRWGFNRYPNYVYALSQGFDLASLGFSPSLVHSLQLPASQQYFPSITMGDLQSFGGSGPTNTFYYSTSFSGTVSKFKGRHNLKAGGDYRAIHVAGTPAPTVGSYSFTSGFTNNENAAGSAILGTGASLASMLLGYPSAGTAVTAESLSDLVRYSAGFVQDDFRLSSKLTLNFGMRYEYETGIFAPNNRFNPGFDAKAVNPVQTQVTGITALGVLEYAGQNGYPTTARNPNHDKLGPRAGFAYSIGSKTVLRGGYGLFWAPLSFGL